MLLNRKFIIKVDYNLKDKHLDNFVNIRSTTTRSISSFRDSPTRLIVSTKISANLLLLSESVLQFQEIILSKLLIFIDYKIQSRSTHGKHIMLQRCRSKISIHHMTRLFMYIAYPFSKFSSI
ncbi:hypothetical protein Hanom_Chr10g00951381 [Helianthus anomalus]